MVPSSWLALSCNLLEKFMPWFDRGLPSPPEVPKFPPLDGVGLYELGGGLS